MANNTDNLSHEESEANKILRKASFDVHDLEKQIKNLPSDKGPAYELRPPGSNPSRPLGTKAHNEQLLRDQQARIKEQAKMEIGQIWEKSSPEMQQKLSKRVEDWEKGGSLKELDESQERADQRLSEQKSKTEQSEAVKQDSQTSMSMSTRFSQSLGYSQWKDEANNPSPSTPNKSPDIGKDKNED